MNDPERSGDEPVEMTVAQYARHFGVSENTVRTRINRKKLNTVKRLVDERETILILVPAEKMNTRDHSEQPEIIEGTVHHYPVDHSESSPELFTLFRETMERFESYSERLSELSRENEKYKLLTDGGEKTVNVLEADNKVLKDQVFEMRLQIEKQEYEKAALEKQISELQAALEAEKKRLRFWPGK